MKTQIRFILIGFVFLPGLINSQAFLKAINPEEFKGNYMEFSKQVNMYYDTATGSSRGGYKQWKRSEWFTMHHLDEKGNIAPYEEMNINAIEEMKKNSVGQMRSPTGDWSNIGSTVPGAMARQGRVNSIAFDPVDGNIIYVATAGGGIWKSLNNGDTWTNLTIDLPILGISDIVVAPAPDNNTLYALLGDLAVSGVGAITNTYPHYSIGVIKSINGGLSWARTNLSYTLNQNVYGYKILMHPTNSNILIAAMTDGIHRTMDGGITWQLINAINNVNDIEFKPDDPNILYFCVTRRDSVLRQNLTTGAFTFVDLNSTDIKVDRMEIGVTADNPEAVYALGGRGYVFFGANLFFGLYYSGNSGSSFVQRSVSCSNNGDLFNGASSISWYANTIYVDPLEENNVIVGGLNLFSSTDGGVTLNQVTLNSIHADQHNIKRNPVNGHLWLGNDGGIYRSTNGGSTWDNRSNDLIINEYYRISGTINTTDLILGGTQDNGHFLRNAQGDYQSVLGSDGMDNYFSSWNIDYAYACTQNGGLTKSTNGGQSFSNTSLPNAGNSDFFPWITPIVQHPPFYNSQTGFWENTDVIYVYSLNGIIRSTDGNSWPNIGPAGNGGSSPSMVICSDANGFTNLYISNGNNFWMCSNPLDETPIWLPISLPISPTTNISALAVNPANRLEVWATISGYISGVKVFRSVDAGLNWSPQSLALPNIPVYSITFANETNNPSGAVYIGTEIGVFYKDDNLINWVPYSNGIPHVPVTDLQLNYVTNELKAATYGRGIWETDVYEVCPPSFFLTYNIFQGQFNHEASGFIIASHTISGGIGTRVTLKSGNQILFVNGFRAYAGTYLRAAIGNCGSGPLGVIAPKESPKARHEESSDLNNVSKKE